MTLVLDDDLFDAQFVRALAYVRSGGAELGECLGTARRITKTDGELWYREWLATAERAEADAVAAAGDRVGARDAYLRASNYFRTAGLFLMGSPVDERFRDTSHRQTAAFRAGSALFDSPPEILAIPYEGTTLPGYFFRAGDPDDRTPRATMILTNGYDGTVEELYFANAAAALERGYHVLAFDGPGQGSVILDQGIPFRPDWENVVTPVVDVAVARPEVDADRLVLVGWSFGGYTAARAATGEHRLAACVADSGPYDLYDATVSRIPGVLAHQLPDGNRLALGVLEKAMESTMRKPSAGWALRRNLWVHDVADPMAFIELARDYTMKGREHLVRCPTFVAHTLGDDISADAPKLAAALTCPTEYVEFGHDDDVTGHCEMTGRAVFHERLFRWLDDVLGQHSEAS